MKHLMLLSFTAAALALTPHLASAAVVEFHIAAGTASMPWNTKMTPITGKVGDVIRFFNDDVIPHQLHTNGAPCPHGPQVPPGTSWDCTATRAYSSSQQGALYDHAFGEEAAVWLEIVKKDQPSPYLP